MNVAAPYHRWQRGKNHGSVSIRSHPCLEANWTLASRERTRCERRVAAVAHHVDALGGAEDLAGHVDAVRARVPREGRPDE